MITGINPEFRGMPGRGGSAGMSLCKRPGNSGALPKRITKKISEVVYIRDVCIMNRVTIPPDNDYRDLFMVKGEHGKEYAC